MSTIYTGNPANVTTPLAATVTGATNVAPIVITTVANHLYATNDLVTVSGVTGNTAANGAWTIIVLSPTTFSLTGTTGNGAYAGGGTCSDNSLTPQFTLPSDGDAFNAAAFNVPYQAIADRTQFLALRVQRADSPTSATGTWTCPAGVFFVEVESSGGGGGGGGGCGGNTVSGTTSAPGGGGGAGSPPIRVRLAVVPLTVYAYAIGAGGAGGAAGAAGAAGTLGGDGGNTIFSGVTTARGAGGGQASGVLYNAVLSGYVPGGTPAKLAVAPVGGARYDHASNLGIGPPSPPYFGGRGGVSSSVLGQFATEGGPSQFLGGALGGPGPPDGTYRGGGGGGGGGAGAGVGGAGGSGASGMAVGNGLPGFAGANPAANTAAGGGGGGGGGQSNVGSAATGGPGAAGGSGYLILRYVSQVAAVFT